MPSRSSCHREEKGVGRRGRGQASKEGLAVVSTSHAPRTERQGCWALGLLGEDGDAAIPFSALPGKAIAVTVCPAAGVGSLVPQSPISIPAYLISGSHQQSPKSPDGSCNDPIHSVIQGEAQQEEETSIQKEAQDTAH